MLNRYGVAGAMATWLMLVSVPQVSAAPIAGTLDALATNVTVDGADLLLTTFVGGTDILTFADTDDLSAVPLYTSFGPLALDLTDPVGAFTFQNAIYGSFVPTAAQISTWTETLLVLALTGIFTPGPGLVGDATGALIEITIALGGGEGAAPDATLALTALPSVVPEPGVSALLVLGGLTLAGRLAGARGRRRAVPTS